MGSWDARGRRVSRGEMRTRSAFFSTTVRPGKATKLALPPCSSLELSNAAIEPAAKPHPSARSVLECDLATHSFVLCALVPVGPRQAALGAVITNDPAQRAWFFLKARARAPTRPRARHPRPAL